MLMPGTRTREISACASVRSARLLSRRRSRLAVVEAYEPAEGGRLWALGAGREKSVREAFGQKADHWRSTQLRLVAVAICTKETFSGQAAVTAR